MATLKNLEQIIRKDGKNCFVEVLCNALAIDKIVLTFVSYDPNLPVGKREISKIVIYLGIFEAARISESILNGQYDEIASQRRAEAQAAGSNYPKPVFTPILGGTPARSTTDGKAVSRQLRLTPGNTKPWLLDALQGPGRQTEQGLIVPDYKKPDMAVRIALTDDDLMELALALKAIVQLWTQAKFGPVVKDSLDVARERVLEAKRGYAQQKPVKPLASVAPVKPVEPEPEEPGDDYDYDYDGLDDSDDFPY